MKIAVYIFALLASIPSFAIKGNYLPVAENPTNVCLMQLITKANTVGAVCTGTLISSDELLSAGHCLRPDHTVVVSCDYQSSSNTFAEVSTAAPKNPDRVRPDEVGTDFIIFKLAKKFSVTPMKVCARLDDCENELFKNDPLNHPMKFFKDSLECRVSGYGRNNANVFGILNTVQLDNGGFVYDYSDDQKSGQFNYIGNATAQGDSGGPLYCLIHDEPVLIGVASAVMDNFGFFWTNLWAALGTSAYLDYIKP